MAYPKFEDKPILIVPKDPLDNEMEEAEKMYKEGLTEAQNGGNGVCAALAIELDGLKRSAGEQSANSKNSFDNQIKGLQNLPLVQRAAYDKEKLLYWQQERDTAMNLAGEAMKQMGLSGSFALAGEAAQVAEKDRAEEKKVSKVNAVAKRLGSSALNLLKMAAIPPTVPV